MLEFLIAYARYAAQFGEACRAYGGDAVDRRIVQYDVGRHATLAGGLGAPGFQRSVERRIGGLGLAGMRFSISDTAEYGDLTRGPRVIDEHVRENMRRLLADIREGGFAREWIEEMDAGEPHLAELRERAADEQIEEVGAELRGLMQREAPAAQEPA